MLYALCIMTQLYSYGNNFLVSVTDKLTNEPIVGANVYWANTTLGTTTDIDGKATFEFNVKMPDTLVVSYVGYKDDSIVLYGIENIVVSQLEAGVTLDQVNIIAKQSTQFIRSSETGKVEIIAADEMRKAACCNLAEGFQTSSAVEVYYSDAVTGSREIQMLGLEGVYIQHLNSGLPAMYGIAKGYYMDRIPSAWVKNIAVAKGIPSVKNGISGITGSINIDFASLEDKEKTFIDLFQSAWGRTEIAGRQAIRLKNDKWGAVFYGQGGAQYAKLDRNHDGFLDIPLFHQSNIMNAWDYDGEHSELQLQVSYLNEYRRGGQTKVGSQSYTTLSHANRIQYTLKNGFFFDKLPGQSIAYTYNGGYNIQDNTIGHHKYNASELMNNFSLIGSTPIKNTMHKLNAGLNFYSDIVKENLDSLTNDLRLIQGGAYVEYTYSFQELLALVLGYRIDYHSKMQWQQSPRLQIKYTPTHTTTFRVNIGRGFRYPVALGENLNYLASSRNILIHNEIQGDIGWNYGISFLQKFKIKESDNSLNIDFYRTHFVTQTMTDLDSRDNNINIHQYDGISYANNLLAELNLSPFKDFSIKLAYKWDDVKDEDNGQLLAKAMLAPHKGLATFTYDFMDKGWSFTTIVSIQGKRRMPTSYLGDIQNFSKRYAMANIQISKRWKNWQWYAGVENINHFRQKNPILQASTPYSYGFDATQIWAPVIGASAYTGLRFIIKEE